MIYQPYQIFSLKTALAGAAVNAAILAVQDFIAGENKSWAYYAGAVNGYMAAATGITGAAASLYAVGNTITGKLFHSPEGSLAQMYVDGILAAEVDTFLDNALGEWRSFSLAILPGVLSRIDIVNADNPNVDKSSLVNWLALGEISTDGSIQIRSNPMNTLVFRLQDDEQNSPNASIPIHLPDGLTVAQVQAYANLLAAEIDALTESQIVEANVTFQLTVPGTVKQAPTAGAFNERGGLISFDTAGPRASSIRIPAIDRGIMPGDSFALTDADVSAFVTRVLNPTDVSGTNVQPLTEQGYEYTSARAGKKSFRR